MYQTDTGKADNLETGTVPACRELAHSNDPLSFLSNYANEAWKGKVLAQDHPVDKRQSQDSPAQNLYCEP